MRHLKMFAVILAVSIAALPAAGQKDKDKIFESAWTATPVQIDGAAVDWAPETLNLWNEYKLNFGFRHDANFLFLIAIFNDPKFISSLDQTGMTIWINPEGKNKKTHGFHLRQKMVTADQLIGEMEEGGQILTEERKAEIRKKPLYRLFACDVVDGKGNPVPHPGTASGTYRYARSKTGAAFEAVVPLALLDDPAAKTKLDLSKPFKLGFEWGGMTAEMKRQRAAQIGERGVQARAGETNLEAQLTSGYEGGGGDMGGGGGSLTAMRGGPKKYDFWINLKFADRK
ncbi:MAG: hypothetical protein FJY82_14945 [Candidatus Aminicenantes bacterium]|nr:hypothetical protein [Candidatus Aminicenantes bacterium]